jgi:lactate racemase
MNHNLKYGDTSVAVTASNQAELLTLPSLTPPISKEEFRNRVKDFLLNSPNLDFSDIALVVADKSRRCDYPIYLPLLLEELEFAGAGTITIYIAYGTHAPQSREESLATYGDIFDKYKFIHHDCSDGESFVELGTTSRGTPVKIRKDVLKSTCRISFGAISHHYFAGYGGGRKLFFPGLAEKSAIYANHGLFLDREIGWLSSECNPGQLDGNPLAEDLKEIADFFSVDMSIHGILDSHLNMINAVIGSSWNSFLEACSVHGENMGYPIKEQYDYAIASCGGYPKDINIIQAHKSMHHASMLVRDGGTLILLAECKDLIGSQTFLPWFNYESKSEAFDALSKNYQGNGGTALSLMTKAERINIKLVTDLSEETCNKIGVEKLLPEELQECIDSLNGTGAIIPNAGLLVPIKK